MINFNYKIFAIIIVFVPLYSFSQTKTLMKVPGTYPTIQSAIDASSDGDKILVAATGSPYMENINLSGKSIELEGDDANPENVVINGGGLGSVVTIEDGGTPNIHGFKITNGTGRTGLPSTISEHAPENGKYGGGIFIYNSSPTLENLHIVENTLMVNDNHGGSGAGIYIGNSNNVNILGTQTIIGDNISNTYRGGGICIDNSSNITINAQGDASDRILVQNNSGGNYGGGIAIYHSFTINLTKLSITGNLAMGSNGTGGGIYYHRVSGINTNDIDMSDNHAARYGDDDYTF